VAVAVIGLIHLPFPFQGDHAFFATVASAMHGGARLYVDLWDINQPGIFLFYLAGGSLFGFTEWGIRLFELFYWLGFSVVLLATVGRRLANPVLASLLPIFTVGAYYLSSDRDRLMKLEALVAFPIFVAVWLAYRSTTDSNKWLLFGSGLAGGVVVSFKLALAVILIPIWLMTLYFIVRAKNRPWWKTFASVFPPVFLGSMIPIGLLIAQLGEWGALKVAFETAFLYPFRYLSDVPRAPLDRLLLGFIWLAKSYGLILVVAGVGIWFGWRKKSRLVGYMAAWGFMGLVVHLLQDKTWWPYHLHLLTFAAGILAAMGLDYWWSRQAARTASRASGLSGKRKAIGFALVALSLMVPVSAALLGRAAKLAGNDFGTSEAGRTAFQGHFSGDLYSRITGDVAFLKTHESRDGAIFVAGDPLYYWLSGRTQAVPLNGWALEYYFHDQWTTLADQVETAMPTYVFIQKNYEELIGERGSDLRAILDENYEVLRVSELGTWLQVVA
jgi:hypothetical protein